MSAPPTKAQALRHLKSVLNKATLSDLTEVKVRLGEIGSQFQGEEAYYDPKQPCASVAWSLADLVHAFAFDKKYGDRGKGI